MESFCIAGLCSEVIYGEYLPYSVYPFYRQFFLLPWDAGMYLAASLKLSENIEYIFLKEADSFQIRYCTLNHLGTRQNHRIK